MKENFKLLEERIVDVLDSSNIDVINNKLEELNGNIICIGSGGSKVVADFACKVFEKVNKCKSISEYPRNRKYRLIDGNEKVFLCSYSGSSHDCKDSLKKYVFTNGLENSEAKGRIIRYNSKYKKEVSFISLASTMMPMTVLLNYYLKSVQNTKCYLNDVFLNEKKYNFNDNLIYEIMSGEDTKVASTFLETTLVEAGIGLPIVHDKQDYCHGRSTMCYYNKSNLIYLKCSNTELDETLLNCFKYYDNVYLLESSYGDDLLDNYNLTLQSMFLVKQLAEYKDVDLSDIKYNPLVKDLYNFKGQM